MSLERGGSTRCETARSGLPFAEKLLDVDLEAGAEAGDGRERRVRVPVLAMLIHPRGHIAVVRRNLLGPAPFLPKS